MVLNVLSVLVLVPTIWIVDAANGPGTNFTSLPDAVSAAQSGDILIVRAGTYDRFTVSGKALTIYGAGPSTIVTPFGPGPNFQPTVIQPGPLGSSVYIGGVSFLAPAPQASALPYTIRVMPGSRLVLSDVNVTAQAGTIGGGHALHVEGQVHAVRSTFQGGLGVGHPFIHMGGLGGAGAIVVKGELVADSCLFVGGTGADSASGIGPGSGGEGVSGYQFTHVFLYRSSCTGGGSSPIGHGGSGVRSYTTQIMVSGSSADVLRGDGYGSYGARTDSTGSITLFGNVTVLSGITGAPTLGNVTLGLSQLPTVSILGTSTPSGEIVASSAVAVTLSGVPLAPFALGVALFPAYTPVTAFPAPAPILIDLGASSLLGLLEGTFDSSGSITISLTPLIDAPDLLNVPIHTQFGVIDASGALLISNEDVHVYRN